MNKTMGVYYGGETQLYGRKLVSTERLKKAEVSARGSEFYSKTLSLQELNPAALEIAKSPMVAAHRHVGFVYFFGGVLVPVLPDIYGDIASLEEFAAALNDYQITDTDDELYIALAACYLRASECPKRREVMSALRYLCCAPYPKQPSPRMVFIFRETNTTSDAVSWECPMDDLDEDVLIVTSIESPGGIVNHHPEGLIGPQNADLGAEITARLDAHSKASVKAYYKCRALPRALMYIGTDGAVSLL